MRKLRRFSLSLATACLAFLLGISFIALDRTTFNSDWLYQFKFYWREQITFWSQWRIDRMPPANQGFIDLPELQLTEDGQVWIAPTAKVYEFPDSGKHPVMLLHPADGTFHISVLGLPEDGVHWQPVRRPVPGSILIQSIESHQFGQLVPITTMKWERVPAEVVTDSAERYGWRE